MVVVVVAVMVFEVMIVFLMVMVVVMIVMVVEVIMSLTNLFVFVCSYMFLFILESQVHIDCRHSIHRSTPCTLHLYIYNIFTIITCIKSSLVIVQVYKGTQYYKYGRKLKNSSNIR